MSNLPYTDDDLRTEAARQYAEILRAPDLLEVGGEMYGQPIPSTAGGDLVRWRELGSEDWRDARNEVRELLTSVADVSRWAVDLGANHLTRTTELTWGHPTNWTLAVQVAHRRGLNDDLRRELVDAIRNAVRSVIDKRGINCPDIPQHDAAVAVTL